jgi:hypothetical protein
MICKVDQSGKIEDTHKLTVVAFGNGKAKSLQISAVEKRKLITTMRSLDYPKQTFVFRTFAALAFLLLKDEKMEEVIVDKEYPGHEGVIKDVILHLFTKTQQVAPSITFAEIGKKSGAHKTAIEVFRGERKPDIIVKAQDVLALFY